MAQIQNPKKQFQFQVIAAGLNPYTVQTCNLPDWEIEVVEHGDLGKRIKTAGISTYGNLTLEKLRPIDFADNWIWQWIQTIRNPRTGGGLLSSQYKRDIDVVQLSYDNQTVTDRWEISGAWPTQINGMELSRTASENSIESIELSVDDVVKTQ